VAAAGRLSADGWALNAMAPPAGETCSRACGVERRVEALECLLEMLRGQANGRPEA